VFDFDHQSSNRLLESDKSYGFCVRRGSNLPRGSTRGIDETGLSRPSESIRYYRSRSTRSLAADRHAASRDPPREFAARSRVFICAYAQILSNRGGRLTKLSRTPAESIIYSREEERKSERELPLPLSLSLSLSPACAADRWRGKASRGRENQYSCGIFPARRHITALVSGCVRRAHLRSRNLRRARTTFAFAVKD